MKREKVTLKLEWCQKIAETCIQGRASFPRKWGEKSIPEEEQLLGKEDLGALLPILRGHSPWLQGIGEGYRTIFGKKDDWYPVDSDGNRIENVPSEFDKSIGAWKAADPSKTYELSLNRDGISGIVWCCILRLHVYSVWPTSTRDAVDIWWPIAEAIGKTTAIKKYMGLSGAKRVEWEDDPAPVEEKA